MGNFPWALFPGQFSLGIFPWEIFPGQFSLGIFPWALFPGHFSLGNFPWAIFPGHFSLGNFPWAFFLGKFSLVIFPWVFFPVEFVPGHCFLDTWKCRFVAWIELEIDRRSAILKVPICRSICWYKSDDVPSPFSRHCIRIWHFSMSNCEGEMARSSIKSLVVSLHKVKNLSHQKRKNLERQENVIIVRRSRPACFRAQCKGKIEGESGESDSCTHGPVRAWHVCSCTWIQIIWNDR